MRISVSSERLFAAPAERHSRELPCLRTTVLFGSGWEYNPSVFSPDHPSWRPPMNLRRLGSPQLQEDASLARAGIHPIASTAHLQLLLASALTVTFADFDPLIAADGSGGAILLWERVRFAGTHYSRQVSSRLRAASRLPRTLLNEV